MGVLRILLVCALAILGVSCSKTVEPSEAAKDPVVTPPPAAEAPVAAPAAARIFGVDGQLMPSDLYVVGVRMPVGVELVNQRFGMHTYRLRAPLKPVLRYFGPLLITGKVERQGRGAIYRRASLKGAEISPTKVDVSLIEVEDGVTRIAITELPPPPEYPPAKEETLKRARREFQKLD
ncbi:MAG: hypothetical protein WBG86_19995 [Polyangiales bacterium]